MRVQALRSDGSEELNERTVGCLPCCLADSGHLSHFLPSFGFLPVSQNSQQNDLNLYVGASPTSTPKEQEEYNQYSQTR